MSSRTRASTSTCRASRLRAAHVCGASVSARYVRQFNTKTALSHPSTAASFSSAACTHICTAGSTSASSARSIVAFSFSFSFSSELLLLLLLLLSAASAVCRESIERRSCACVRNCCGGVRDVSVGSREIRRSARPCAAIASKKTAYDAAVVLWSEIVKGKDWRNKKKTRTRQV